MSGGYIALIVIAVIFGIIVLWLIATAIGTYNGLVQMNEGANNAFSDISVQYQRRYDLIPNLVESCKVYMAHESETLTGVVEASTWIFRACFKPRTFQQEFRPESYGDLSSCRIPVLQISEISRNSGISKQSPV